MNIYDNIGSGKYTNNLPWRSVRDNEAAIIRKRYHENEANLRYQFYLDCCCATEVPDDRKSQIIFDESWEQGHSSGLGDVYSVWLNLWELLEKINKVKGD